MHGGPARRLDLPARITVFDRPDEAQELRRVELRLPPGMVARLRGVEYCPETSIAAAAQRSGASVKATAACPQKSSLGFLDIDAGSGPRLLGVHGKVYLAGPYKGAPSASSSSPRRSPVHTTSARSWSALPSTSIPKPHR
jgi:hypothetical protein